MENLEKFDESEKKAIQALESLDVNYRSFEDPQGRTVYLFFNISKDEDGNFLLDADGKKIVFKTFHFDHDADNLKNKLIETRDDLNETVYSCCYPEEARKILKDLPNAPIIIGTGNFEYKTVYNSIEKFLTVSAV